MTQLADPPVTIKPAYKSLREVKQLVAIEAQRGYQGGSEYWVAMVPIRHLVKMLVFQDRMNKPGKETQRSLNVHRSKRIAQYVKDNLQGYIFSGLTVSLTCCNFEPVHPESSLGTLYIAERSLYLTNDGQHRLAALKLLWDEPELREALEIDSISVDFRSYGSEQRQRQIFSDLNLYDAKPAKGLSHYFDGSDPVAAVTRQLIKSIPQLTSNVNVQKNQLGKKDVHMFTFKAIYDAVALSVKHLNAFEADAVISHWRKLVNGIVDWQMISLLTTDAQRQAARQKNICFASVGVAAIGSAFPVGSDVPELIDVSWSRFEPAWQNVCVFDGKLRKNAGVIKATAQVIKQLSEEA